MPGKMAAAGDSNKMMYKADQIWNMLDEMAKSDPAAYRSFIEKQLKEGKEAMAPPQPHMCIQTTILEPHTLSGNLFVNVFQWARVPAPKNDEAPIPVMGGEIYNIQDENNVNVTQKVVCLAFNAEVLQKYGRQSPLVEERRMLVNLGLDFISDQHRVTVSRDYTALSGVADHCQGALEVARDSLMRKTRGEAEAFDSQLSEMERTFGPMAAGCKSRLLGELARQNEGQTATVGPSSEVTLDLHRASTGASTMIEEISSTERVLARPSHTVDVTQADGVRQMVLRIELPGVTSVSECELDLSENDVQLVVKDKYELSVKLAESVKDESARAKFSRKSSTLTIMLPTQSGVVT